MQDATSPSGDAPGGRGPSGAAAQATPTVIVRFGKMGHIGEFACNMDRPLAPGVKVVVRTARGVELGTVVAPVRAESDGPGLARSQLEAFLAAEGPDYPFDRDGRVLRVANRQDVIDARHLSESAREEAAFCRQQISDLRLEMKVVSVEHLLGGERIVFFFTAATRVDFRELVRRLAARYRTRIEMRQVGARDEARLVADYERCGLQCCCQRFLRDLRPVSMRMAKSQKATLDPAKISGRCGRLMCCLRYEDACYEQLRQQLPRKNTWVRTEQLIGKVVDSQVLTQLVRLGLPGGGMAVVANEDIVERDVAPPSGQDAGPGRLPAAPAEQVAEPPPGADDREDQPEQAQAAGADERGGAETEGPKPSRRKRRRGGRPRAGGAAASRGRGRSKRGSRGSPASRRRGRRKGKAGSQASGPAGGPGEPAG